MAVEPYRPLELMQRKDFTKSDFTDFIGIWENFVPRPLCKQLIEYCDNVIETGSVVNPHNGGFDSGAGNKVYKSEDMYGGSLNRKDFAFMLDYANRKLALDVQACLTSCIHHYVSEFGTLTNTGMVSTDIKVQMTPPGGGYHMWHYEDANQQHAMREVVWMIYLNDVPDGEGETEFLYQKRRIKPTAGTVVMWPAGYTHTHKGNTVFSENKYILTGWYIKAK